MPNIFFHIILKEYPLQYVSLQRSLAKGFYHQSETNTMLLEYLCARYWLLMSESHTAADRQGGLCLEQHVTKPQKSGFSQLQLKNKNIVSLKT